MNAPVENWTHEVAGMITRQHIVNGVSALIILILGAFIARRISHALTRLPNLDTQQRVVIKKFSYYVLITLVVAAALNQLGFDLRVLLGAAGVLTVAIGFAAQTSASNLISGLFLIIDPPFRIGDVVKVGDVTGEVMAVDILSSKIRTFDNLMVRIPNETMVKSNITNLSRFPIRRIDLKFGVGYRDSIADVRQALMEVAQSNPLCLEEPPPLFIFNGFGASSQDLQFSVWALSSNLQEAQNQILIQIKERFDQDRIEIPFPHMQVLLPTESASPS